MAIIVAFAGNGIYAIYALSIALVLTVCTIIEYTQHGSTDSIFRLSGIASTNISSILLPNIPDLFYQSSRICILYIMRGKEICSQTFIIVTKNMVSIVAKSFDSTDLNS
jgi:hypothetical protein